MDLKDYELEYARLWQQTKRIIFSKTLNEVKGNARLLRKVDPDEIRELKKQSGNDMTVGGSDLAPTFINYELVDEYRLYIHPVVLGSGKAMFSVDKKLDFEFVESQRFPGGVIMLKYHGESTAV